MFHQICRCFLVAVCAASMAILGCDSDDTTESAIVDSGGSSASAGSSIPGGADTVAPDTQTAGSAAGSEGDTAAPTGDTSSSGDADAAAAGNDDIASGGADVAAAGNDDIASGGADVAAAGNDDTTSGGADVASAGTEATANGGADVAAAGNDDTAGGGADVAAAGNQETGGSEEIEPFALTPGVNELTWDEDLSIGTTTRHLVIHTPRTYPNNGPFPILFAFHGNATGAPEDAEPEKMWLGKLGRMVDQGKFIGIYLRGVSGSWQLGSEPGGITTDEVMDTLTYLKARMAVTPGVDDDTTYCFGSSNGAALCQYTAANVGMFTGIGAQVSTLDAGDFPDPNLPKVSVVQMMNFEDIMIPYEGGPSTTGHDYMAAEDGALAWATHNGCDPNPAVVEVPNPKKKTITYSGCQEGTIVVHVGANPIPWEASCEGAPPSPELEDTCGNSHTVDDGHFMLPGGPLPGGAWRYAFDLLSGAQ